MFDMAISQSRKLNLENMEISGGICFCLFMVHSSIKVYNHIIMFEFLIKSGNYQPISFFD